MSLVRRRDASVQRRAASAAAAAKAAEAADDLMESLLEDSAKERGSKNQRALESGPLREHAGERGRAEGGMLGDLVGNPLTLGNVDLEDRPTRSQNPEVRKVVVGKSEGSEARKESPRSKSAEPRARFADEPPRGERPKPSGNGKGVGTGEKNPPIRNPRNSPDGVAGGGVKVIPPPGGESVLGGSSSRGVESYYIGEPAGTEERRTEACGSQLGSSRPVDPWLHCASAGIPPDGTSYLGGNQQCLGSWDRVNPFWSRETQVEATRMTCGNVGGSQQNTPQKGHVETDPIELFRLRCLRDAEEKFRKGLAQMAGDNWSHGSVGSFVSAGDEEAFVPPPPPGPPPKSPPRTQQSTNLLCFGGTNLGQFIPPFPQSMDGSGNSRHVMGENAGETLRSFELPVLHENSTPLQYGDWLSLVDSLMGDLSYTSDMWWGMVRNAVEVSYKEWLVSNPMDRLRIKPKVDPRAAGWPRTERRALAMLLAAIPESIRNEIVSTRRMSTEQVLFRLSVVFQPGGSQERFKLLQSLTDSKFGTSAPDVLEWVRTWRRQVRRSLELGIVLPDALVLTGILTKCADVLCAKSPQISYRLNMVRQQIGLDYQPHVNTILVFAEHLQAEAEELSLSSHGKTHVGQVKAAALSVPPGIEQQSDAKPEPSTKKPCKFWMTEKGCRRGDGCRFEHVALDPKSGRCFGCSAVGHSRKDCPHKNGESRGDGHKKTAKLKQVDKEANPQREGKGTSTKKPKGVESESGSISKIDTGLTVPPGLEETTKEHGLGEDAVVQLLSETNTILKTMNPTMKAVKIKRIDHDSMGTGLLDGGATNPLRRGSPQELAESEVVLVELAHGTVELRQHPLTGCILTEKHVEPIVPLRGLIDLGYVIKWSSAGCEIRHPTRGTINCWLRSGCPVVSEPHALALISEIEAVERAKRGFPTMNVELLDEVSEWWSQRFPEVPKRVWRFMAGQNGTWNASELPWNRAQRRRHATAKALIIHLYSGADSKEWRDHWPDDVEVITVDVREGQNAHHAATWGYLWQLAGSGRVIGIIGGPPCRTTSRLLDQKPGPPRLRSREGLERFGFGHLTLSQQQKADGDTALLFKQVGLYMHAEESWKYGGWPKGTETVPNRVGFLLESPEDPKTYLLNDEGEHAASFWTWPEIMGFCEKYAPMGMQMVHFDQGCFGHQRKKPTSCMTNLPEFDELNECRCGPKEKSLETNLPERLVQTASWATWAPGLKRAIRLSLLLICEWHGIRSPKVAKLTGLDSWKQHLMQQHRPYRRDCRECALEMASGRPHRRREHGGSSAWTMAIDAVPMKSAKDLCTGKVMKYALVATALVPVFTQETQDSGTDPEERDPAAPWDVVDASWWEGDEKPMADENDADEYEPSIADDEVSEGNSGEAVPMGPPGACDASGAAEADDLEKKIMDMKTPWKVRHVTMVEPIQSRATAHVIKALDTILTKMNYLGVTVRRLHSDRAKELLGERFQSWIAHRNIYHSFTSGDDPQSNGHVESEIHQIKRRTRLLLRLCDQPMDCWPQVIRYVVDERLRTQLSALGSPVTPMPPYWSEVAVKRKRWHDPGPLASPFVAGRLLGASPYMTNGWMVLTKDNQVVHAREVIVPDPLQDQARLQLIEETSGPPHMLEVDPKKTQCG